MELPSGATAAQRRALELTRVENERTGEVENKQTLMAREQYQEADDKAAPGRLRYRHGSRMSIISEDEAAKTGFWFDGVYQFHCAVNVGRKLQTKAGPLPLEGIFEVGYARIAEIRKGVGQGSVMHPRLSVRCEDASRCEAVLIRLVEGEGSIPREDRSSPPLLVPLLLLGCKVHVQELTQGGAYSGGTCTVLRVDPSCGGPELRTFVVDEAMFAASVMLSGGDVALEEMKLPELKEELAVRGAVRSGMKAALQRRLHALLMQAAIDARRADAGESGDGDGEQEGHRGQKRGRLPSAGAVVDSSDEEGPHQ